MGGMGAISMYSQTQNRGKMRTHFRGLNWERDLLFSLMSPAFYTPTETQVRGASPWHRASWNLGVGLWVWWGEGRFYFSKTQWNWLGGHSVREEPQKSCPRGALPLAETGIDA